MTGALLLTALLMMLATASLRVLPFLIGHRLAHGRLRRVFTDLFPAAVLAVLIVHFGGQVAAGPEIGRYAQGLGALATVLAHLRFRNLLLSVGVGTVVCMVSTYLMGG